jgi:branched-chain amino acid transport system permease protein
MIQFFNVAVGAVMAGAVLALIALGMTLIYRLTRIVSLAQGAIVVVGALTFNSLVRDIAFVLALLVAVVVGGACGLLLERLAIRPSVRRLPPGSILILTVGALMAIEGCVQLIWGSQPYSLPNFPPDETWIISGVRIPSQAAWILGILAVISVAAWLFLTRTRMGIAVRASAENPDTATMMGIDVSALRASAFTVAGALSALAGVASGPVFSLAFDSGTGLTNYGFIAVVLGGLGSVAGGIVGGFAVGIIQQFAAGYIPSVSSNIVLLFALLLVLILRPQGLLGGRKRRADAASGAAALIGKAAGRLTRRTALVVGIGMCALLAVLPLGINSTVLSALIITGILAIAVLGLDIVVGFSGQISLGHAGFMAIGAYTTAVLTSRAGWELWPALGAGIVFAAVAAFILALTTVRLSGLYLALATLAFGMLIDSLAIGMASITGGSAGMAGIPGLTLFGTALDSRASYYLVWGIAGFVLFLLWNLTTSDFGRTLRSIKADPAAARSIGIPVTRYKMYAFMVGAVLAGLAGGLYASYLRYVSPDIMGVHLSFALITMLIIGGEATLVGGVAGVALLTMLPTQLQVLATYSYIYEGLLLIVILLFLPEGLWGGFVEGIRSATSRFARRRKPKIGAPARENAQIEGTA